MNRHSAEVDEAYKARWSDAGHDDTKKLAFRSEVAQELFKARPLEYRNELKAECVRIHENDMQVYNDFMDGVSDVVPEGEAKTKYVPCRTFPKHPSLRVCLLKSTREPCRCRSASSGADTGLHGLQLRTVRRGRATTGGEQGV